MSVHRLTVKTVNLSPRDLGPDRNHAIIDENRTGHLQGSEAIRRLPVSIKIAPHRSRPTLVAHNPGPCAGWGRTHHAKTEKTAKKAQNFAIAPSRGHHALILTRSGRGPLSHPDLPSPVAPVTHATYTSSRHVPGRLPPARPSRSHLPRLPGGRINALTSPLPFISNF